MQKDDCCDSIDTIVGAKINGALVSLLAEQTGHNSNNLEELVNVIKTAFTELDELKRWKKVVEEKNGIVFRFIKKIEEIQNNNDF